MTAQDELTGDDALAAEYVLGVLAPDERQDVVERIARDRGFARLVDDWEARLGGLSEEYAEATPPAHIKTAVDRRLFEDAAQPPSGLWESLAAWRTIAGVLAALLVLLVVVPVLRPTFVPEAPRLVALLDSENSAVSYLAIYEPQTGSVALSRVGAGEQANRDFELWVINKDEAPVSIGVIPPGEAVRVALGDALRGHVRAGANLAISLEPKGGSPTGRPTGPVVAMGELRNI
ncbi:MAG: anti-sigma factor [Rhizobiales bacterium]|nr:anti-sigma factor [Hyphomicrobiales bacterium]